MIVCVVSLFLVEVALFVVIYIQCLIVFNSLIKVFNNFSNHLSILFNSQLNLQSLPKLIFDQIAVCIQLVEIVNFQIPIDWLFPSNWFIKNAFKLEARVLELSNIPVFLMMLVQIVELDASSAQFVSKFVFN